MSMSQQFYLDLPKQTDQSCSPSQKKDRYAFFLATGINLPVTTDATSALQLFQENRLQLPKVQPQQMRKPGENEYDWLGNQSTASIIDNGFDSPQTRNLKFIKEVREKKMSMINPNVRVIKENGHIVVPYKGSSWEKLELFRNKASNKTITMQEIKSLSYMESYLKTPIDKI